MKVKNMKYNLTHWNGRLPKVSCQCITYGRTNLLDEAVESFLRQDYEGEKEMVILNDYPDLEIVSTTPGVKVFNFSTRIGTIGEKRNVCVSLCSGDVIFPWDDDDISLPFRISYSLEAMKNLHYYKPDKLWYWENGNISHEPKRTIAHAMGAWSLELFRNVGGYPLMQSGQDQAIEELFKKTGLRELDRTPLDKVFYIYRFPGTGSYHLSSYGYNKGYDQVQKYVSEKGLKGRYEITPTWSQNYSEMIENILSHSPANDNDITHGGC